MVLVWGCRALLYARDHLLVCCGDDQVVSDPWEYPEIFTGENDVKYLICREDVITKAELIRVGKISAAEIFERYSPSIGNGDLILDIGAHYGGFGIWAAKQYPWAVVHAWEPQKQLFYELCGNAAINHLENLYAYELGVGSASGTATCHKVDYRLATNPGANKCTTNIDSYYIPAERAIEVKIAAIDSYNFANVKMIKIDVEGMEGEVLDGAKQTIAASHPMILLEAWQDDKVRRDNLINTLKKSRYNKFTILGDNIVASSL